jgi:hypothetical protein
MGGVHHRMVYPYLAVKCPVGDGHDRLFRRATLVAICTKTGSSSVCAAISAKSPSDNGPGRRFARHLPTEQFANVFTSVAELAADLRLNMATSFGVGPWCKAAGGNVGHLAIDGKGCGCREKAPPAVWRCSLGYHNRRSRVQIYPERVIWSSHPNRAFSALNSKPRVSGTLL